MEITTMLKRSSLQSPRSSPLQKRLKIDADAEYTQRAEFLGSVFQRNGFSPEAVRSAASSKLLKPTPKQVQAYTLEVTTAVRFNDLNKLRELYESGAELNCCNRFGDSLVHIACRRGHTEIVKFLVEEVQASVHFVDDLKRTPLHDACWTSEPNFEIVDVLLRAAPEHVLCRDQRGHTPFDYARKTHWRQWVMFLWQRSSLLKLKAFSITSPGKQ
jgi:ankyrin repeat protein